MIDGPAGATEPATIDVDRAQGVVVTWGDGHVSRFGLQELRESCPCAQCRGLRDQGGVAWAAGSPEPLRIESAREVGNWGLNLHWSDGHTTGIYTYETLRSWCPCDQCTTT